MHVPKLIVYKSAGIGDFIKTWPVLRQEQNSTIVIDEDRGKLANAILGIKYRDISMWKNCFNGKCAPPDYVESFDNIIIYRHMAFKEEDEGLRKLIHSVVPKATINFRSFQPSECKGKDPQPNQLFSRGPLFHVGVGKLLFNKDDVPNNDRVTSIV